MGFEYCRCKNPKILFGDTYCRFCGKSVISDNKCSSDKCNAVCEHNDVYCGICGSPTELTLNAHNGLFSFSD